MSSGYSHETIEALLHEAAERDAGDLFIIPDEPPTFRTREGLIRSDATPYTRQEVASLVEALVGQEALDTIGKTVGEIRRPYDIPGVVSAGLCVARSRGQYTLYARVLPPRIYSVADVSAPQSLVEVLDRKQGLILISGPVGSGKTTLAIALVDYINTHRRVHICTVEEPAYTYTVSKTALLQQRFVGLDVPDILSGIQAALEQDADVIYVSETRSVAEVEACLAAAQTGHLVMVVLHSPTPEAAVASFLEAFPGELRERARKVVATTLVAATAQRLMPLASGRGRVPAYGLLLPDREMRMAIAQGHDPIVRESAFPAGCRTIAEDIARLLTEGLITTDTAKSALESLEEESGY